MTHELRRLHDRRIYKSKIKDTRGKEKFKSEVDDEITKKLCILNVQRRNSMRNARHIVKHKMMYGVNKVKHICTFM